MRVCSLFCGIGGIDLAFTQAGHEIVWANDIDKYACMTYRHNFPDAVLVEGDIRAIDKYDIPPLFNPVRTLIMKAQYLQSISILSVVRLINKPLILQPFSGTMIS